MVWTKIFKKSLRNIEETKEILRNIEPALENVFLKKNVYMHWKNIEL